MTCNESSVLFAWKWALLEIFELVQLPILFVVVDDDFSLLPIVSAECLVGRDDKKHQSVPEYSFTTNAFPSLKLLFLLVGVKVEWTRCQRVSIRFRSDGANPKCNICIFSYLRVHHPM